MHLGGNRRWGPLILCHKHKLFLFFLLFVLEHVSSLHFLGKQNSSKYRSFCRVNIGGIRFSELNSSFAHNTSWHRYI